GGDGGHGGSLWNCFWEAVKLGSCGHPVGVSVLTKRPLCPLHFPRPGRRLREHAQSLRDSAAHELAEVADQFRDLENHGAGTAVLVTLAVHFQPQVELMRVGDFVLGHQPRTHRAEGVAALALVPGAATLDL
nr:hypothetical protein [Tanacetum cinerariifolium]